MPVLTVTVGLPGCGKTTWTNKQIEIAKSKTININLDDVRQTMAGTHSNYKFKKDNEQYAQTVQCNSADLAVAKNWNIIVSDTNLNPSVREKWKKYAKDNNYLYKEQNFFEEFKKGKSFEHEYFAITKYVQQCKERNITRSKVVPEEVIDRMADDYFYSTISAPPIPANVLQSSDEYIIVDIDGTLAHKGKRNPYDESKVLNDAPDVEVILSVIAESQYLGRKVIIMSGRHDTCKDDTIKWLEMHNVPFEYIFMRAGDDNRPDDVVKYELYINHVLNNFKVVKVFDDREKVVKMWRRLLGLKVFAVAEGNF